MFTRALIAFLVLPGLAAFILPLVLACIDPWRGEVFLSGVLIMLPGLVLLLWCVRDFYASGKGTLAPWDPPKHLVVSGLYRHVRNPMYVGVVTLVLGWAVLYLSPLLLGYDVVLAIAFHIRVVTYEEQWLARQFGSEWREYRSHVGRWVPRFSPWRGGS